MEAKVENLGKVAVTIEEDYWNIEKDYDKLTIVEREGTGTTFISRKPVPAGTSILNRNYWIKFSRWADIPYNITQNFGDSEELAISQKILTAKFNEADAKIDAKFNEADAKIDAKFNEADAKIDAKFNEADAKIDAKFNEADAKIEEGDDALDGRLRAVEALGQIMVDGGSINIATSSDLENPQTQTQEASIPTVRAIIDSSDDEPHLNSTKRFVSSDDLAKMYGYYLDNPEFIYLVLDENYHIIFGLRINGDIVFGIGVPSQIKEYVRLALQEVSDGKVDKVNGKSLINEDFSNNIDYIDNPEFLKATVDNNGKLLNYIDRNGTHYFYKLKGETIDFIINEITKVKEELDSVLGFTEDKENRLEVKTDLHNKIINYRKNDGTLVELSGIETPKVELKNEGLVKLANDLGDYLPNKTSLYKSPNLPKYGTTNIKTELFYLTAVPGFNSIEQVELVQDFEDTAANATDRMTIYHYYFGNTRLRHYAAGRVKLNTTNNKYYATETIRKVNNVWYYADTLGMQGPRTEVIEGYTEVYNGATPASGNYALVETEVVQVTAPCCVGAWTVEDWDYYAVDGTDIGKKYEHYCIADVDFGHYFSKTDVAVGVKHQGNSTQGYRKRNYRYTFYKNSTYAKKDKIKIGEMLRLSKFNLKANWVDNTRIKELTLYRIFYQIWNNRPITDRYDWDNKVNGLYHGVSGNIQGFPIALSVNNEFYGLYNFDIPKDGKNYLIDDEDESTGLFVSGAHNTTNDWGVTLPYNIADHYDSEMDSDKWSDYPAIVEALTNWTHFINKRLYKGSDDNEYNISELTDVGGTMYVTSTLSGGQVTQNSISARLIKFNRENIAERLDVLGFIDYMICMQVFLCYDNQHNNMIMYSGAEKKKMYPFFYDLDGTIPESREGGVAADIFADNVSLSKDMSLWRNLRDEYWDDMVNRYCQLRKTYLSLDYIKATYTDIIDSIPEEDVNSENYKWGGNPKNFNNKFDFLSRRLAWLDENYFNV